MKESQEEDKSFLDFGPKCGRRGWEVSRLGMNPQGVNYGFLAGPGMSSGLGPDSVCPYSLCDLRRWLLGSVYTAVGAGWRVSVGSEATAPPCS